MQFIEKKVNNLTLATTLATACFFGAREARADWEVPSQGIMFRLAVQPVEGADTLKLTLSYPTYITQPGASEKFLWTASELNGTNTVWTRVYTGHGESKYSLPAQSDEFSFLRHGPMAYYTISATPPNQPANNSLNLEKVSDGTFVLSYSTDGNGSYRLERRGSLSSGQWSTVARDVSQFGSLVVSGSLAEEYFRLVKE